MNPWQIFLILFCGLSLTQSIFLSTSLLVKDKFRFGALFYAALLLLGLALRLLKSIFIFVQVSYPLWGVVAGGAGLWMIGPSFYLYTIHTIDRQRRPSSSYLIHFIPSVLILLTGITEYVYYVGLVQFPIYFSFACYLIVKTGSTNIPKHFQVFATGIGLMLFAFIVQAFSGGIEVYTLGAGLGITVLYAINYFFVKDSEFFSSFIKKSKAVDKNMATEIISHLNKVFTEKKIYRNKGLTIAKVAEEINYPSYLISQSINQQHGIRFNEFVNKFRVQEAMERLKKENDKIETIAKEVGFSSMSSLYEAFKKETHVTPHGYRSQFGSGEMRI